MKSLIPTRERIIELLTALKRHNGSLKNIFADGKHYKDAQSYADKEDQLNEVIEILTNIHFFSVLYASFCKESYQAEMERFKDYKDDEDEQ